MANVAANVAGAPTGSLYQGLTSATAPTGTASATTGFIDLGYVSEDGVTVTVPGSGDKNVIHAWQNGDQVRVVRTPTDDIPQIQVTLLETKLDVVQAYFGVSATQTGTEGAIVYSATAARPFKSYLLDVIDGADLVRYYVPKGLVSAVGDLVYNHGDAVGYQVTIDCEFDSTTTCNFKAWMTKLHS